MNVPSLEKATNQSLSLYLNNQSLSAKKPKENRFETMTVDFKDREKQNTYYTPEIVFDSLDVSGGLVFTTSAFEKEFSINGAFTGNLSATLNKKDMDVTLALYELMPNGKYFFITRYVRGASYAEDNAKRQLLMPNQKENIPINTTRFVSRQIGKGSKLVVLLNVNKHPFEIVNYGSGKDVVDETIKDAGEPLQIRWHNDSFIRIPIWKD